VIAAANQARAAKADLIVTVGGGSITDGAKAVQLCLANDVSDVEGIDGLRTVGGAAPALKAPTVRQISAPTTIAGGEFTSIAGVTNERTKVKERCAILIDTTCADPRSGARRLHAGMAVAVDRYPRRRSLRRGHLLARGRIPMPTPRREGLSLLHRRCRA